MGQPITGGNPREIDANTITEIHSLDGIVVGGGEPVLNFSTKTLLEVANEDQEILIHFNGTVRPDQEFLDLCKRFKSLVFCFSIDGVGERFEYLRWPAKWDRVQSNVAWMRDSAPDNVRFAVNITVSPLNKHYYPEIIDWVKQAIPCNRAGVETHISYNHTGDILPLKYLDSLDIKRNQDWKKLFPLAITDIT
jgi:MoaA/NifB/PqqE/SkfB family radical SAM enzyme